MYSIESLSNNKSGEKPHESTCVTSNEKGNVSVLEFSKLESDKATEIIPNCDLHLPLKQKQWTQYLAAFSANIGSMALGTTTAWTSTALPDLRISDDFKSITKSQEAWIGSVMILGAIVSCPVAGVGIERFGRRMSMLLLTLPFIGGWLLIYFASNIWMIYAGRFITGFCAGAFSVAVPIYVAETADTKIRGALGCGYDLMITIGILYIFLIGTYTTWRIQALSCAIIPAAFHCFMFFVPESPRLLVEKNKTEEAAKSLQWLRGTKDFHEVEQELKELQRNVEETCRKEVSWRGLCTMPVIKPTFVGFALMFIMQLSGMDAVMFYTVDIFRSAGTHIDEHLSTNIVGAVQVAATVVAALVVDRCGRRILLIVSGLFMVISLTTIGLYFYLKSSDDARVSEGLGWLPLASLIVYVISFSIGLGPVPCIMLGELLPPHVKGIAAGMIVISKWTLGFIITLMFQDMLSLLHESGCYWLFASITFLGVIYICFCVPETNGKSLEEIQLYFSPALVSSKATDEKQCKEAKSV
ncbi:unnamed protein product [Allacma fusca]|uniref:Major facilitator superfamily (MFS) profile domain-containing protein n=1 Tax=Allacma fusca TaxID=39272 RepID=A0A8J2KHR3_9HEXA|nr:unnamed protein product [Allacma fusca]